MSDSEHRRLSVAVVDVVEGHQADFAALARELDALIGREGYGRADTVRDDADPGRFYATRHWVTAAAAARCHADVRVHEVLAQLSPIARVVHVVNGVRPFDPHAPGERRVRVEGDRRIGFDRRIRNAGRADGERRVARDRREAQRRAAGRPERVDLVAAARDAREYAEAPFSKFKVGAAIETTGGAVVTGCNVENATYGLTICAERVAVFKAMSEGHRSFTRVAVVADTSAPTPPCGACRQILWEFGGDLEVILANLQGVQGRHQLKDLLPLPFDARLL
jgi:cytidine deaminase